MRNSILFAKKSSLTHTVVAAKLLRSVERDSRYTAFAWLHLVQAYQPLHIFELFSKPIEEKSVIFSLDLK